MAEEMMQQDANDLPTNNVCRQELLSANCHRFKDLQEDNQTKALRPTTKLHSVPWEG